MTVTFNQLMTHGFICRDDLLPLALFEDFNCRVVESWRASHSWRTKIKRGAVSTAVARLDEQSIMKIGTLFSHNSGPDDELQYMYHSIHESEDDSGLIADICTEVTKAWSDTLDKILGTHCRKTNFSLTCYTKGCFLSPHTDSGGDDSYKVTLILYFGAPYNKINQGELCFDYRGEKSRIPTVPNRSILFIPTPETLHWIPMIEAQNVRRFAFSGWYI